MQNNGGFNVPRIQILPRKPAKEFGPQDIGKDLQWWGLYFFHLYLSKGPS